MSEVAATDASPASAAAGTATPASATAPTATARLLEGAPIAREIRAGVAADVQAFVATHGFVPTLAIVVCGSDAPSMVSMTVRRLIPRGSGIWTMIPATWRSALSAWMASSSRPAEPPVSASS